MSMLNIPSYKSEDPNYRYKMPKLVAKVEGRGNGIRTNIVNMGDIARALKRPPDYPTKFCGHELGAQSKFDSAEGKAIVNGAHEQRDLQVLIDKFIDKFVLCQHCGLPEIDLQLKKGRVTYRCNACGDQGEVDNTHKLATFILKNPPDGCESTMGAKSKKSKEERQKEKALKQKKQDEGEDSETEKKKKSKSKDDKEKKSKKSKKTKGESEDEADVNGEQLKKTKSASRAASGTSSPRESNEEVANADEEKKKKEKKKAKKLKEAALDQEELEYTSPEIIDVTQNLLNFATKENEGKLEFNSSVTPSSFFDHLRLLQVSQAFNHRVKVFVALDVLFHPGLDGLTAATLQEKIGYIAPVTQGAPDRDILTALEDFVLARVPECFKNFPYFLQKLYSADIIEEGGILKYYSNKKVEAEGRESYTKAKVAAKPFLDWLQQSDSDDSEDENEEDESDEVQQTLRTKKIGAVDPVAGVYIAAQVKATDLNGTHNYDEEVDDDFDIDDI